MPRCQESCRLQLHCSMIFEMMHGTSQSLDASSGRHVPQAQPPLVVFQQCHHTDSVGTGAWANCGRLAGDVLNRTACRQNAMPCLAILRSGHVHFGSLLVLCLCVCACVRACVRYKHKIHRSVLNCVVIHIRGGHVKFEWLCNFERLSKVFSE